MKHPYIKRFFIGALLVITLFGTAAIAASTGTIDPNNTGQYKAAFLDGTVMVDTAINFGKFTTQSQYNITVSDTELRGYAWGSSVGYIVTNCANTTSGCSATNGNFKIANNGGLLSGYAWGENTGWINFGPFTNPNISTVKIGADGNFGGTLGAAGYAWSQNYGWIVFDCTNANTCVHTNWSATPPTPPDNGGGLSGGGASGGGGGTGGNQGIPPSNPTNPTNPSNPSQPSTPTQPSNPSTTTDNGNTDQPPATVTPPDTGPTEPPAQDNNPQPNDNPATQDQPGVFDNGLQLPPALSESLSSIVNSIGSVVTAVAAGIVPAANAVINAARTPAGKAATTVASAVGAGATLLGAVAAVALANPLALVDLALLPLRLWSLILVAFGIKKRNHPWGTVYDSVTKQPIDPAYVMLTDLDGNEIATSITDIDGRYGFSVPAGTYKIIANKTNFIFPSVKLVGRTADELYPDLYFGGTIVVAQDGSVITKNIPMDQQNFDWNEFAKVEQKRLSYYKRTDLLIARLSTIFFYLGVAISIVSLIAEQNTYNKIILIVYLVLFLIRRYSPQYRAKGSVTDSMTGEPLPFAIVHILSQATGQEITHKVADRLGNYYCLVPNGTYTVAIDKKNPDASYTKVTVPYPVVVKKGYLQESFKV